MQIPVHNCHLDLCYVPNANVILPKGPKSQWAGTGSDNDSSPNRGRVIIWTNDAQVYWCIYVPLGIGEFTRLCSEKIVWTIQYKTIKHFSKRNYRVDMQINASSPGLLINLNVQGDCGTVWWLTPLPRSLGFQLRRLKQIHSRPQNSEDPPSLPGRRQWRLCWWIYVYPENKEHFTYILMFSSTQFQHFPLCYIHWGQYKLAVIHPDDVFKFYFSNENFCILIQISLEEFGSDRNLVPNRQHALSESMMT